MIKKTIAVLILIGSIGFARNDNIFPVTVNEKFPDFELPAHDGKTVSLANLSGSKVMLVFIRGRATEEFWCGICQYQYLELAQLMAQENWAKKYNIKVFFVLPYSADTLDAWLAAFPTSLNTIAGWKNPVNPDGVTENQKIWAEYCREFFPHEFSFDPETFKLTIPVLFDEDHALSEGLQVFRTEWGGTQVDQNVPTIFILDETGRVKFKYFSQYTNDRPDAKYLSRYLKQMF